jgi:hypothetical protein
MPATQPYVEIEKQIRKLNCDIIVVKNTLAEETNKWHLMSNIPLRPLAIEHGVSTEYEASVIRHKMVSEQKKVTAQLHVELEHLTWHLSTCVFRMSGTQVENERRTFVRACPWENCRGFLSPVWKCGMCDNWTCPDCHEVKGPTREAEHTCDPSNVATAQLLAKDSRNCPNCAAMIFKINGCFAKDTKIPMFDGTTKLAQDISIGDVLIGDDGTPRKVLDTCKGRDEMFKVQQNKGVEYTVNSKHKLVLKFSGHKSIYKIGESFVVRWFDKSIKSKKFEKMEEAVIFRDNLQFPDEIEMLVEDYMKLGDSTKKFMMGFKSSGVVWPRKEVRLDPYIMGLWLGDGIPNKDGLRTSIRVSSVGQGDYYGWMVDCNKRFVLEDFTVVRNCDQMYCTQCHTAFSWKTGRIETGVVHNPHYFEYQRARGTLARQPGDVPCGGFPDFSLITRILRREHVDYGKISRAYRSHLHCQYAMIPRYTVNAENDNRDLRIKLMIGDIPEDLFKKKIQQREKARQRKTDIRQVLEMYMAVLNDLFQGFVSTANITELTVSLDALRNHVTSTFKAVSARYTHCAVPVISEMFDMY